MASIAMDGMWARRRPGRLRSRLHFGGHATPTSLLIVAVTVTLVGLGLVMVLSSSSARGLKYDDTPFYYVNRQAIAALIGVAMCCVGAATPYRKWLDRSALLLAATGALLVVVVIPGLPIAIEVNGAKRWLDLGFTQFQPSELAKFALIIYVAKYLSESGRVRVPVDIRPILVVFSVMAGLVMAQPDLGTTVLLFSVVVTMVLIGEGDRRTLAWSSAGMITAGIVISAATPFRRERLLAFLDPWQQPTTAGYQTLQAQVSFASGGLFGSGIGSAKAKYGYLPEAHTDFIFAILGEEFGLVGSLVVMCLFLALTAAGFRVAMNCYDVFGRLLAVGISTWIGAQALINLGVATGALPNKGITLPLMSYGGSSLIVTLFAIGVLLNIARSGA